MNARKKGLVTRRSSVHSPQTTLENHEHNQISREDSAANCWTVYTTTKGDPLQLVSGDSWQPSFSEPYPLYQQISHCHPVQDDETSWFQTLVRAKNGFCCTLRVGFCSSALIQTHPAALSSCSKFFLFNFCYCTNMTSDCTITNEPILQAFASEASSGMSAPRKMLATKEDLM